MWVLQRSWSQTHHMMGLRLKALFSCTSHPLSQSSVHPSNDLHGTPGQNVSVKQPQYVSVAIRSRNCKLFCDFFTAVWVSSDETFSLCAVDGASTTQFRCLWDQSVATIFSGARMARQTYKTIIITLILDTKYLKPDIPWTKLNKRAAKTNSIVM
jgi:hypothetical protein